MDKQSQKLLEECRKLPLFRMVWFHQNILGLASLDDILRTYESQVLRLLLETERTPVAEALSLQAMSQCWMFGMYELFRTWRQMINELIVFAEEYARNPKTAKTPAERSDLNLPEVDEGLEDAFYGKFFEKVKSDKDFRDKLISTKTVFKELFQPIEELRVLIAKFEIPQTGQGRRRFASPYARISSDSGSLYWFVTLRDGQRNFLTRQQISNLYVQLAESINNA